MTKNELLNYAKKLNIPLVIEKGENVSGLGHWRWAFSINGEGFKGASSLWYIKKEVLAFEWWQK